MAKSADSLPQESKQEFVAILKEDESVAWASLQAASEPGGHSNREGRTQAGGMLSVLKN